MGEIAGWNEQREKSQRLNLVYLEWRDEYRVECGKISWDSLLGFYYHERRGRAIEFNAEQS